MKRGGGPRPAISRETCSAISRNGCDDPCALEYLANPVVTLIRNKHVARFIESETGGSTELGTGRCTAIPRKSGCPSAGIRGDDTRRSIHLANAVVESIGDIKIVRTVDDHAGGII